ncbi:MAG: response regulator transcription factor [Flavobacteriales bacterium]|nr:response regulator transcription factor [Flavobacteriales bacterium]
MINIAIVDDHKLFNDTLAKTLPLVDGNLSVIIQSDNGKNFLDKLQRSKVKIDVALIDYQMPIMGGARLLIDLSQKHPEIKSIIISFLLDKFIIIESITNGARGYLSKNSDLDQVVAAIKAVNKGNLYFNELATESIFYKVGQGEFVSLRFNPNVEFTTREMDVIKLIGKGLIYKEIANKLNISQRTVEDYKNNIFKKIGSRKATDIVLFAAKKGWI